MPVFLGQFLHFLNLKNMTLTHKHMKDFCGEKWPLISPDFGNSFPDVYNSFQHVAKLFFKCSLKFSTFISGL